MTISEINDSAENKFSALQRVRDIILAYGWNSTSYQIINPGINHWFAARDDAVVGFVGGAGVRVAVGAPVCTENRLAEVAAEFEADAARTNETVCYLAAESRLESINKQQKKYAAVLLGAQPVWNPAKWRDIIAANKSLRAQLNRARNKGVKVSEWSTEKARDNPLLNDCLEKWLDTKGLPPLAFMVEPRTLSRLFDRRVLVAKREREVVGSVLLSPVATRSGWLFEQFVHCPAAPNGTVELMIDFTMRSLADGNFDYATLGLAPLSTNATVAPFRNPLWLRLLLEWARLHGRRFYNFDGLDAFKAKLKPEKWEPVFALTNEPHFSPRTIYAIAAAFSRNQPFKLIFDGSRRALAIELNNLKRKFRKDAV